MNAHSPRQLVAALGTLSVLGCVGCGPGFRDGTPSLQPTDADVPLTRVLDVALGAPARVQVDIRDSRGDRSLFLDEPADRHAIPLLGFRPNDEVELTVTATDDLGGSWSRDLAFEIGELPSPFPLVDVLVHDRARREPGLRLMPIELADNTTSSVYVMALDEGYEPVWVWAATQQLGVVRQLGSGSFLGLGGALESEVVWEVSPIGEILRQWGQERAPIVEVDRYVEIGGGELHHELLPLPEGGFLTFGTEHVEVEAFDDRLRPVAFRQAAEMDISHCGLRSGSR